MGVAVPIISAIAQGATGLIGARSSSRSIRAESRFAVAEAESRRRFDERALKSSAKLRKRRVAQVIRAGKQEAHNRRRMRRRIVAQQRLGFAGQGIQVFSGSAARVISDTLSASAADITATRINALRQALGMRLVGIEEELRTRIGLERFALGARVGALQARQRSRMTLLGGGLDAFGHFGRAAVLIGKRSTKKKKRRSRRPSGGLPIGAESRSLLPDLPFRGETRFA